MYNVLKFIRNTQNQYVASVNTYSELDKAKVFYHQTLASFYNADDVLVASVKIENEFGYPVDGFMEIIDHTPEPEPEETVEE